MKDLIQSAREIREMVVRMLAEAGSGHTAGSLGSVVFLDGFVFGRRN